MILHKALEFIRTNKQSDLKEVAQHIKSTPEATAGILGYWIHKGKIKQIESSACEGCNSGCAMAAKYEIYAYVEDR